MAEGAGKESDPLDAGETEAHARARIGTWLRGKYRLDRVLGVGGMAAVYAATHRNGKVLAIKVLHPHLCVRADVISRFLREGHAANKVQHPGAVSVLDDDVSEDGSPFLVMDFLQGPTVHELWVSRGGFLHPAWVVAISIQLLDVMAAAHVAGVIHRDLKPENLLLTASGEVKVLDFGIARFREAAGRTTSKGTLMGTPSFMAPEQALGKIRDIDERTDLWAIGSIAFALLAGDVVHPGSTTQDTVIRAATRAAPPLDTRVSGVPVELARVIDRALSFKREDRWPSAVAMRQALTEAVTAAYGVVPGASVLAELSKSSVRTAPRVIDARSPQMIDATTLPGHDGRATFTPVPPTARASVSGVGTKRGRAIALTGIALTGILAAAFAHNLRADPGPVALMAIAPRPTVDLPARESTAAPGVPAVPDEGRAVRRAEPIALRTSEPALPHRAAPASTAKAATPPAAGSPAHDASEQCAVPYSIDPKTGLKVWKAECL